MVDYNLVGRIRPVYRGVWNAETAYTVLETVTAADNHAAYIAIKNVPVGILLNNEEYWGVLVDVGGLEGAGGGVSEEIDPTVPAWAKEEVKPTYTAAEVGAIADASGVLATKHYGANSINSTKLADDAVWPRHISDLVWNEVDSRINAATGGDVPNYVIAESAEVASKVLNNRSPNSITLIMASDIHVDESNPNSVSAITDMGSAMHEIKKRVRPDAFVLMGDYVDDSTQDAANGKNDMLFVRNATIAATNGTPTLWINGNHDGIWHYDNKANVLTPDEVYSYIGAQSDVPGAVIDYSNIRRNYGYVDIHSRKTRLIWVNTSDNSGGESTYNCLTNIQLQWIIDNALNLSDKGDDEKNWGVVTFGHIPIQTITSLRDVLDAFKGKTSGSTTANGGTVTYDFTSVAAQHLVHFNGHTHNFVAGEHGTNKVLQVGIPNACPYNEDTYGGESVDYPKSQGTANSTSFCAVVVDRDEKLVKAYCYGAGYDREVPWTEAAGYTNVIDTVGYEDGIRLSTSNGATKGAEGAVTTGLIDLSSYAYPVTIRTRGVDFSKAENRCAFAFYNADGTMQTSGYLDGATGVWGSVSFDSDGNLTMSVTNSSYNKLKICGIGSGANLIVTVNEEIK